MGVPLFILQLLDWHFPLETIQLPSGHVKIAIEHGPVEIVDFPIKSQFSHINHHFPMVFPWFSP